MYWMCILRWTYTWNNSKILCKVKWKEYKFFKSHIVLNDKIFFGNKRLFLGFSLVIELFFPESTRRISWINMSRDNFMLS